MCFARSWPPPHTRTHALPHTCRVVDEIERLACLGTPPGVLVQQLSAFSSQLVKADAVNTDPNADTRYFPTERTIRNIAGRAIAKLRYHKYDQPAVEEFVKQRMAAFPDESWFFRPSTADSKFLLVHQTPTMRSMLQKYGSVIAGMDATYKVTKWQHPCFLVTVVTNHGHGFPAALFFVEQETGEAIAEALRVLRDWNPEWKPEYIMLDKSDQEINAVHNVLPRTEVCFR